MVFFGPCRVRETQAGVGRERGESAERGEGEGRDDLQQMREPVGYERRLRFVEITGITPWVSSSAAVIGFPGVDTGSPGTDSLDLIGFASRSCGLLRLSRFFVVSVVLYPELYYARGQALSTLHSRSERVSRWCGTYGSV